MYNANETCHCIICWKNCIKSEKMSLEIYHIWQLLHKQIYMYLKTRLEFYNVYLRVVWWFWVSEGGGSTDCYSLRERSGTGHCLWTGYCRGSYTLQVCPTSHSPSYRDHKGRYINSMSMCNKHLSCHLFSFR